MDSKNWSPILHSLCAADTFLLFNTLSSDFAFGVTMQADDWGIYASEGQDRCALVSSCGHDLPRLLSIARQSSCSDDAMAFAFADYSAANLAFPFATITAIEMPRVTKTKTKIMTMPELCPPRLFFTLLHLQRDFLLR